MDLVPDQPKAAVGGGHRKHLAMLERLSKRSSSSASASSSPAEAFLSRFAGAKLAAESALSACRASSPEHPAAASLAAAASALDDIDRLVAEASHTLPPYELRAALATAADLRAAHRAAASELRPKKSFSFRNKNRTPNNPPQDPATALPPPSPRPEQPKPNAILPGFGFRGRNGATLVKDLRVASSLQQQGWGFHARRFGFLRGLSQGQMPGAVHPEADKLPCVRWSRSWLCAYRGCGRLHICDGSAPDQDS
ncbi:hypothetical protein BS78_09G210600 [Paspalum vaginatum]|nr:hypothetical protein BS78_09G210600 [Paspalum vaginatum]